MRKVNSCRGRERARMGPAYGWERESRSREGGADGRREGGKGGSGSREHWRGRTPSKMSPKKGPVKLFLLRGKTGSPQRQEGWLRSRGEDHQATVRSKYCIWVCRGHQKQQEAAGLLMLTPRCLSVSRKRRATLSWRMVHL